VRITRRPRGNRKVKVPSEKRFYRELIRKADDRFDAHLARLKKERK
jgi:hypothetical protein